MNLLKIVIFNFTTKMEMKSKKVLLILKLMIIKSTS